MVIEVSGIGYKVNIASSVFDRLPSNHSEIKLYIYHIVREDAEDLYGFLSKDERSLFALLITVSGVGPKAASSLMSALAVEVLSSAIVKGNADLLSSAPGIGKKTAQKICIELKEKMAKSIGLKPDELNLTSSNGEAGIVNDAIQALLTLGYTPREAREAVLNCQTLEHPQSAEEIIKAALKALR